MNIIEFINAHWGIIIGVVIGIVFVSTHRKLAYAYAKSKAKEFILIAETQAEQFLLENGQQKMAWVVDQIYQIEPAYLKPILTKPVIQFLAQAVFDKALEWAKEHRITKSESTGSSTTVVDVTSTSL